MHVWRRPEAERNSPVAQDRFCVCATTTGKGIRFQDLKDGASYLTEYLQPDETIMPGAIHEKRAL